MKKAFEVVLLVTGSYKERKRTTFVEAESKEEILKSVEVCRVIARPDMNPDCCPYGISFGEICEK